ncbi:hypothetical protein [Paraglaciecola sp.]|uniref:hypothetical protein n=1 Tax=Paraglaciecola sp. TaxID=1920173 RepID=UPI0030F4A8D2
MKILLWRASVQLNKVHELEQFLNTKMLQLFKQYSSCSGVTFLQYGAQLQCLSYWESKADAQLLLQSEPYQNLTLFMLKHWIVAAEPAEYTDIQGGFITNTALTNIACKHIYDG